MEGLTIRGAVGQLIYDIASPAAKEIGEMFKDELRPFRAKRQEKLFAKTLRMVQAAKIQPQPVAPKLVLSILDNGGIEDDETLHTMWAALLANAADPNSTGVHASFPEILKQLSPVEAQFVERLLAKALRPVASDGPQATIQSDRLIELIATTGLGVLEELHADFRGEDYESYSKRSMDEEFEVVLDNLVRLGILRSFKTDIGSLPERFRPRFVVASEHYFFSPVGAAFVLACRPPTLEY